MGFGLLTHRFKAAQLPITEEVDSWLRRMGHFPFFGESPFGPGLHVHILVGSASRGANPMVCRSLYQRAGSLESSGGMTAVVWAEYTCPWFYSEGHERMSELIGYYTSSNVDNDTW